MVRPVNQLIATLRDGTFLTRARLRLWSTACLLGFALGIFFLFATAHGANDYDGRPLGTDFSDVYAAGVSALHGDPTAPFDIFKQHKQEQALFGPDTPIYGWHYPPIFLLVAAPLATLPYIASLIVWQLGTLALYMFALRALLRRSAAPELADDPLWLLAALGFTAVFVNLTHGHNGFLTAALFAGALAVLDKRPIVAGLLFGLLAYKPQFGILIPLVLAATGRWRTFLAATIIVLVLAGLTTALFGAQVWPAFLEATRFTRTVILEQGSTGFYKIQSVFAWVRLWGGSVPLAYGIQAIASLAVVIGVVRLWRSPAPFELKGAALCLGSILATPYSLDYDLMQLAPPIALMAANIRSRGARPYELSVVTLLWLVPVVTRSSAQYMLIPLGIWAMAGAFCMTVHRAAARG